MIVKALSAAGLLFTWTAAFAQQTITVDAGRVGRVFEGIGALSAGASSRLLIDYPEPERSKVLDLLFKPGYGASFQHLKIEVGGEVNSTDGTEPSHARSRQEMLQPQAGYFHRGYEWWLATEAKKRNPRITIEALAWGAPGWIGGGRFYSQDMADYYAAFVRGMKKYHGIDVDYIGTWNETPYDTAWIKLLRRTLDRNQLNSVKIVAGEQELPEDQWKIAEDMKNDPELNKAIAVIGVHYPERIKEKPYRRSETAVELGKPIWNAEGGPWKGQWSGFGYFAKMYNRCYIEGRMTKVITWSLVSSCYDNLSLASSGPMRANAPWCGHFEVQPCLWAVAHTTQFARPGWNYIDGGCGYLDEGGSFVTLLESGSEDNYSIIIETTDAPKEQVITFKLIGRFSAKPINVWRSVLDKEAFVRQDSITQKDGVFTIELEPRALYSLTTTSGQQKGNPESPEYRPFPFPYYADFEDEQVGRSARYFSDISGVFDVVRRPDGNGKCLRQTVNRRNIFWHAARPSGDKAYNSTIIGDRKRSDYRVSSDVFVEEPGTAVILGRLGSMKRATKPPNGYWLEVSTAGKWFFYAHKTPLAGGCLDFPVKTWHRLEIEFKGSTASAFINGSKVCGVDLTEEKEGTKPRLFKSGLAGIGSGYNRVLFDNFALEKNGDN
jgi:galactosylceramidase